MKIGFTGSRRGMTVVQKDVLEIVLTLLNKGEMAELHHGACIGSDSQAHGIALRAGSAAVVHPPVNQDQMAEETVGGAERVTVLPAKEYLDRDRDIVDEAQLLIATPSGYVEEQRSGTWYTVRYAKSLKKLFLIIWPDGKMSYNQWQIRHAIFPEAIEPFLDSVRLNLSRR